MIHALLSHKAVGSHGKTIGADKDYNRVLEFLGFLESFEDLADVAVELCDEGVVVFELVLTFGLVLIIYILSCKGKEGVL